ncbi:MAG: anhydro-N-acetylmuramic acid kinase [Cyanobacteria bacterium]|nr:anhydro-N-acetylmuramic acid kinase [Cyanobacteria bacterium bin.51]
MSGTSADGVDAVLVSFVGPKARPRWRLLKSQFLPYPEPLQQQLIAIGQGQATTAATVLNLAEAVTEVQADCARLCDPDGLASLVGCHGQTLWHRPPDGLRRGCSWQLLQAPLLAELLQRPVVFDLRSHDLALGGHGAPLMPAADAALLPPIGGWRALLNLGGIANLTLLPPATGPERFSDVRGWDCGPANTLLDLAVNRFSQGRQRFDADGRWAAQGRVHEDMIQRWLAEAYFQTSPPKSTGREMFGEDDLNQRLAALAGPCGALDNHQAQSDALATLTAFSAAVVAADLARGPGPGPLELVVAGGGARNGTLINQLRHRCRGLWVRPLADLGIGETDREALAFALLAWWHQQEHHGSLPSVTGAEQAAVLGVCAHPGAAQRLGRYRRTRFGKPRNRLGV